MSRRILGWVPFTVAALAIGFSGCGGSGGTGGTGLTTGGSTGGSSGGNTTAPVSVFITDNLSNNYSQIWVNVQKVELLSSSGPRTVFDNPAGVTVDLKSLRDVNGARFQFLSAESLPVATYTGVRLTLDKDLVLFPTGATTGQERVFAIAQPGSELAVFDINFSAPVNLSLAGDDIIVDFDLSQWTDDGTKVTAIIVEGDDAGFINEARHETSEVRGTVSGIGGTIPNLTFNLDLASGGSIQVKTSSATSLFSSDNAQAVLAAGQAVEVHGTWDPNARRLQAARIEVEDSLQEQDPKVEGVASDINSGAGTFTVEPSFVRGFLPLNAEVSVELTDGTVFLANSGLPITRTAFFDGLASLPFVEVEGIYNTQTNVLTANKAKLDNEGPNAVHVRGTASGVDTNQQTFVITAASFGGLFIPVGAEVTVATTVQTEFLSDDNQVLDSTQFYSALPTAMAVEVEGTFDSGASRILAKKVKLENDLNANQVEIGGVSSEGNAGELTFKITAQQWFGAVLSNGQLVDVRILEGAELLDDENNPITAEQLFAQVAVGARLDVRGTLQNNVLNADRVRLDPS